MGDHSVGWYGLIVGSLTIVMLVIALVDITGGPDLLGAFFMPLLGALMLASVAPALRDEHARAEPRVAVYVFAGLLLLIGGTLNRLL